MRAIMQEHLDSRSSGKCKGPVRDSDGVEPSRVRLHESNPEMVFGKVSVERVGYGRKEAKSLHPLDAELNLPLGTEKGRPKSLRGIKLGQPSPVHDPPPCP
jgi:hypothetical protein